ncbi:MAG: glyoxalase/bleomycin resistance protein/dioxygenase [Sphingomonas bacterium]|jgi:catechol 2,3-dioxygenase-like lactoylglutathione lyase family enzyme|uniref:VOC family protein n=1 Tax=Sphingomonas bacterium TaxID=1895847 RepID=UPI002615991D|nr:VOC family protein [Sphingomonas bacterium]MDB5707652.1 glyoxalase/bleomycin resistance protein/dioxygenase [Sphingomonas bacterium]
MITLGHVNIRTDRLEETCAFYERLLGFRRGVAATNPDPTKNLWLYDTAGNPSVHINAFRPEEARDTGGGSSLDHIAFNCPDRAAMAALLDREGIAYTAVETRVPGLVQFNIRDPNGVRVELTFGHELVTGAAPIAG